MSYAEARGYIICAIVTIYAGFIFVGFAKYESQGYSQAVHGDSATKPTDSSLAHPSSVDVGANAFPQGHPCNDSQKGSDTDMCQQWRMAEAAEELTHLTWRQIVITAVEVALLIAVLVYTAMATRQASRSADAAIESNRQSREAMVVENRPWLLIENLELTSDIRWQGAYCDFSYRVVFKNFGRTPARNVNIWGHEMILGPDENASVIYRTLSKNPPSFVTVGDMVAQNKPFERIRHVGFSKNGLPNEDHSRLIIIVRVQYSTLLDNEVRQSRYVASVIKKKDGGNVSVTAGQAFVSLNELGLEPYPFCEDYIT